MQIKIKLVCILYGMITITLRLSKIIFWNLKYFVLIYIVTIQDDDSHSMINDFQLQSNIFTIFVIFLRKIKNKLYQKYIHFFWWQNFIKTWSQERIIEYNGYYFNKYIIFWKFLFLNFKIKTSWSLSVFQYYTFSILYKKNKYNNSVYKITSETK